MVSYGQIQTEFNNIVGIHGEIFRIKYYTTSGATTNYNDDNALTVSGVNVWVSGILFSVSSDPKGSDEALLMEQGVIKYGDNILYLGGTVSLSGAAIKIGLGSPIIAEEYQMLHRGVTNYTIQNQDTYKKTFIRLLNNGSFINE